MKFIAKNLTPSLALNGKVVLTFNTYNRFVEELLKQSGEVEITLRKPKKKRSLNQNALLWELIGEISMVQNGTKNADIDIYCQILEQAGAKIEYYQCVNEEHAIDRLRQAFRAVKIVDHRESNGVDTVMLKCYVGTSQMNTQEMNLVIDKAIEYAYECGLDTEFWKGQFEDNG